MGYLEITRWLERGNGLKRIIIKNNFSSFKSTALKMIGEVIFCFAFVFLEMGNPLIFISIKIYQNSSIHTFSSSQNQQVGNLHSNKTSHFTTRINMTMDGKFISKNLKQQPPSFTVNLFCIICCHDKNSIK